MIEEEKAATNEDLRLMLTEFWVTMMTSEASDPTDRIKVSELLAKYILGEGKTSIKKRGGGRPSTADVLGFVRELEGRGDGEVEAS